MITKTKIVLAHAHALYWKHRAEVADRHMRKHLQTLAELGSGKWETEHGFFTVTENNSYPESEIRKSLTDEEVALCYEPKWSNARAKILFPVAYAAAQVQKGYKVSI